jgi:predicted nucleic acid-binding protein
MGGTASAFRRRPNPRAESVEHLNVNAHDPRLAALIERAERFGQSVEAERSQIARLAAVLGVPGVRRDDYRVLSPEF